MTSDEYNKFAVEIAELIWAANLETWQFGALVTTLITVWMRDKETTFEGRRKFFAQLDRSLTSRFGNAEPDEPRTLQ